MLLNISIQNKISKQQIDRLVGTSFTLKERYNLGGIVSPKLYISTSSMAINNLLILNKNDHSCTIEMRPKGIIIKFSSQFNTYALITSYNKMSIRKPSAIDYSIYLESHFLKIKADSKTHDFITKLFRYKLINLATLIEDVP